MNIQLSNIIAKRFYGAHTSIREKKYTNYFFKGGRGSAKSSFVSLEVVLGLLYDKEANAACIMKVDRNIKNGIYNQIQWALNILGVSHLFYTNKTEHTFNCKRTGQVIMCKGCSDPQNFKSINLVKGYFAYQWFEELQLFDGMEEIRSVQQSLTRAGLNKATMLYTYNPPITIDHWLNKYITEVEANIKNKIDKDSMVNHSSYLDIPKAWLGEAFFEIAENLKASNEKAYNHEYLGVITGRGGNVFENVDKYNYADIENKIGYTYRGLDWGFAVDPTVYISCYYDNKKQDLYILDEVFLKNASYEQTAQAINKINENNMLIICDSAEPRSNAELKRRGFNISTAVKGADSVEHGMRWLQSLSHIYIDEARTPKTYAEFVGYEYESDKNGNFKSSFPDKNNHSIDAVRYALEKEIRASKAGIYTLANKEQYVI